MGVIADFFKNILIFGGKTATTIAAEAIKGLPGNILGEILADTLQSAIVKYTDNRSKNRTVYKYTKELNDECLELLGSIAEECIDKKFNHKEDAIKEFFNELLALSNRRIYEYDVIEQFLRKSSKYNYYLDSTDKTLVYNTFDSLRSRLLDAQFKSLSSDNQKLYNCIAALFERYGFANALAKALNDSNETSKLIRTIQLKQASFIKHECPVCQAKLRRSSKNNTWICDSCTSDFTLISEEDMQADRLKDFIANLNSSINETIKVEANTTRKKIEDDGGKTRKLIIKLSVAFALVLTLLFATPFVLHILNIRSNEDVNSDKNNPTSGVTPEDTGGGTSNGGGNPTNGDTQNTGGNPTNGDTQNGTTLHDCATKGHIYTVENKCGACADLWEYSEGLEYELVDGSYEVTGIGTCEDTEVVIPYGYDGKPVIGIGEDAFENCTDITAIAIPDSVSNISNCAFYNCSSLKSINIPTSVTRVNSWAFYKCTALSEITIPSTVTSIGERAFYGCSGLTSIIIPNSITSIESHAFYNCSNLKSITIPFVGATKGGTENTHFGYIFGADTYEDNYIYVPSSLKKVIITDETEIPSYAFYQSFNISSVVIPNSVTLIDRLAFAYCSNLTSIRLGTGVTSIGDLAFVQCFKLVEVINKSSLNLTIGSEDNGCIAGYAKEVHDGESKIINQNDYLFYTHNNDNYLLGYIGKGTEITPGAPFNEYYIYPGFLYPEKEATLTLPESYNGQNYEIYNFAFAGCFNLTGITIGESVTHIGAGAFLASNINTLTIPDNVTSIGEIAFGYCYSLSSVTLEKGVTSIGDYAFEGCNSLISVNIPDGVTSIGDGAFTGCYKLVEIINNSSLDLTKGSEDNGRIAYYALEIHNGESKIVNQNEYSFYTYNGVNYLLGYTGRETAITLPDNFNGQNYAINMYAFYNSESITDISIGNSVTNIGDSAFEGCTGLTSVTIGNGVTNIGEGAFRDCNNLTNINIPNNVKIIGVSAFEDCTNLSTVTIGNGVMSIGDYAFSDCDNLKSVTIPDSVTSFGKFAFSGCISLKSVTIENGVTSIGDYAFYGCTSLTIVSIPNSVTSISNSMFRYCTSLSSINIPNSVTSIGHGAFSGCESLATINIPNSVTSIDYGAFSGCKSLTSITIPFVGATQNGTENTHFGYIFGADTYEDNYIYVPSSLKNVIITDETEIHDNAFDDCYYLVSIIIPNSVIRIGFAAFSDCNKLEHITLPFVGATQNGTENTHFGYIFGATTYKKNNIYVPSSLKNVIITDGTIIDDYAFFECTSLSGVTIEYGVANIGNYAFAYCYSLTTISIPNSVINIGNSAFYYCEKLTTINIPNSVTSIGDHAFSLCGLTSISIPYSITNIGNSVFSYCDKLTSIYIPNSVTSFGCAVFSDCDALTSVTIELGVTNIGDSMFSNCDALATISIPNSVTNIGNSAFSECANLTTISIPNSVTKIGNYAFSYCDKLTSIYIPNSVTSIGVCAFSECTSLTTISIPNSVTSIGAGAFRKCTSLTTINIPTNVTSINEWVFEYCESLSKITIPYGVKSIGPGAFKNCEKLTHITIPNSVTIIDQYAFSWCRSLTSVTIGNGVTSIVSYAFKNCTSLTDIKYRGSEAQWAKISKGNDWDSNTGNYTITYNYTGT